MVLIPVSGEHLYVSVGMHRETGPLDLPPSHTPQFTSVSSSRGTIQLVSGDLEEKFERTYGPLRPVVGNAVEKYLECGILENGFARVVSGKCKAEFLVGYSCKIRMLCPSCHAKRLTVWSEWLGAELLENVPHRMITLTVPKRIQPFFLMKRKLP